MKSLNILFLDKRRRDSLEVLNLIEQILITTTINHVDDKICLTYNALVAMYMEILKDIFQRILKIRRTIRGMKGRSGSSIDE